MNSSAELLLRLVKERHTEINRELENFITIMVGENIDQKYQSASSLLKASNELKGILATPDQPSWLNGLIQILSHFVSKQINQKQTIDWIIKSRNNILGHQWSFEASSETAINFDSIFERYKKESRLPELFGEIIKILEDIKESGEVEKIAMLNGLSKVIATLKQSQNGSYFSMNAAWSFLISFVKNFMWAELSNVPGLSSLITALKETLGEMDKEMTKLQMDLENEINEQVSTEIKGFQCSGSFPALSYGSTGEMIKQLPNPSSVDEKA